MPIYESSCPKCNTRHEYVRAIKEYDKTPECCGVPTEKRIFTAPIANVDIAPWDSYVSPSTGKIITSKAERRADMKASGCRDWEGMDSERKNAVQKKKEEEKKEDLACREMAEETWASLTPETKKAVLNTP